MPLFNAAVLTKKIGPLPMWAYAALGGGALFLMNRNKTGGDEEGAPAGLVVNGRSGIPLYAGPGGIAAAAGGSKSSSIPADRASPSYPGGGGVALPPPSSPSGAGSQETSPSMATAGFASGPAAGSPTGFAPSLPEGYVVSSSGVLRNPSTPNVATPEHQVTERLLAGQGAQFGDDMGLLAQISRTASGLSYQQVAPSDNPGYTSTIYQAPAGSGWGPIETSMVPGEQYVEVGPGQYQRVG